MRHQFEDDQLGSRGDIEIGDELRILTGEHAGQEATLLDVADDEARLAHPTLGELKVPARSVAHDDSPDARDWALRLVLDAAQERVGELRLDEACIRQADQIMIGVELARDLFTWA